MATRSGATAAACPLDRRVIQRCRDNGGTSIKDAGLLALFTGNPVTADRRASLRLAKLVKEGKLKRTKISLEAAQNDGTKWMYWYEAV